MAAPLDLSPGDRPGGAPAQQQNQCLPRSARIRERRHYLAVQSRGARAHGKVLISIAARSARHGARLGITASKKVGKAVQRNRAKRLIRDAFRKIRLGFPAWLDLVVIARPSIVGASAQEVADDLASAARRAVQTLERRGPDRKRPRRKKRPRSRRGRDDGGKARG